MSAPILDVDAVRAVFFLVPLNTSLQLGADCSVSGTNTERFTAGAKAARELFNAASADEVAYGSSSTMLVENLARVQEADEEFVIVSVYAVFEGGRLAPTVFVRRVHWCDDKVLGCGPRPPRTRTTRASYSCAPCGRVSSRSPRARTSSSAPSWAGWWEIALLVCNRQGRVPTTDLSMIDLTYAYCGRSDTYDEVNWGQVGEFPTHILQVTGLAVRPRECPLPFPSPPQTYRRITALLLARDIFH